VARWLSPRHEASSHFVFMINGAVALGVGIVAGRALKLSVNTSLVIAAVAFAGLMVCMLTARAAWVAIVAGSSLAGVVAGYMGAAFFEGQVASVAGGAAIGAGAFGLTFLIYRHFVRSTTGSGGMEGRYAGTFNQLDESRHRASGEATVVIAAAEQAEYELRLTGLVLDGVPVELLGKRREEEHKAPYMELSLGPGAGPRLVLMRGWAQVEDATLIVDLDGTPFGTYVFTGQRRRD
jgi:hypothetical protein